MSVTKHDFPFEYEGMTLDEKISLLYSKIRLYYMLKVFVEDIEVLRDGHKSYLANMYFNERQIQKQSKKEKEKRYAELREKFAICLKRVDRMLSFFPQMLTMGREEFDYLMGNEAVKF